MDLKSTDLISLFEKSLTGLSKERLEEVGIVIQVGDNICRLYGLTNVVFGELIAFEGGNKGIVMSLEEEYVSVFLLYNTIPVAESELAKRTGGVFQTQVGNQLLGRVINALGKPLDGLGELKTKELRAVEAHIPGVIERSPVNESLETGILAIDALVPIGKGQRELIIGNRSTGKTSIALNTIIHQKGKNVICIYVSIGQRKANLARLVNSLEEHDALKYTVVINADASEAVLNQYMVPYVGCTVSEYFRDQGEDVLVIYDDLSNHAIAYREMSLLLRRSPGREAYPGDIFYLHSRLLERAGKLAAGGSITALPIVTIQSDDITAYIPTNLISITDGQLFLDTQLFNQGIRPAVNAELSVSRVGGAAQTNAIKKVTQALRLELAQYHELLDFSQFGTELDPVSQRRLRRGALVIELLKQPEFVGYTFVEQTLMLFLLQADFLDDVDFSDVHEFAIQFVSYTSAVYPKTVSEIEETADLTQETRNRLQTIAKEFSKLFVRKSPGKRRRQ
ncbi:F0F1 ATP synthase subunit alpha [Candidatus Babeliales bacterium]|nr:F0F1 ATP synthase subunit alpha [Candidatus Babeliales bacterium]